MNYIHQDQLEDAGNLWKFRHILVGHQGPLTPNDKHYKGSQYNVKIEWENGEITYEPLGLMKADDPITMAQYDLLDKDGWKSLQKYARRETKLARLI